MRRTCCTTGYAIALTWGLKTLAVGERIKVPVSRMKDVRIIVERAGRELRRGFHVRTDRKRRVAIICRYR